MHWIYWLFSLAATRLTRPMAMGWYEKGYEKQPFASGRARSPSGRSIRLPGAYRATYSGRELVVAAIKRHSLCPPYSCRTGGFGKVLTLACANRTRQSGGMHADQDERCVQGHRDFRATSGAALHPPDRCQDPYRCDSGPQGVPKLGAAHTAAEAGTPSPTRMPPVAQPIPGQTAHYACVRELPAGIRFQSP